MKVCNLGSINANYLHQVPHILASGETLAATDLDQGLGGKGANQSMAMVQVGAFGCSGPRWGLVARVA